MKRITFQWVLIVLVVLVVITTSLSIYTIMCYNNWEKNEKIEKIDVFSGNGPYMFVKYYRNGTIRCDTVQMSISAYFINDTTAVSGDEYTEPNPFNFVPYDTYKFVFSEHYLQWYIGEEYKGQYEWLTTINIE